MTFLFPDTTDPLTAQSTYQPALRILTFPDEPLFLVKINALTYLHAFTLYQTGLL